MPTANILRKLVGLSVVVTVISLAVAWLVNFIPPTNVLLSTVDVRGAVQGGFGTQVGDALLGFFNFDINVPGIVALFVSVYAILLIGVYAAGIFPHGRGATMELFAILLYGVVIAGLVLSFMGGDVFSGFFTTLIVSAVYAFIIALVTVQAYRRLDFLKMPQLLN